MMGKWLLFDAIFTGSGIAVTGTTRYVASDVGGSLCSPNDTRVGGMVHARSVLPAPDNRAGWVFCPSPGRRDRAPENARRKCSLAHSRRPVFLRRASRASSHRMRGTTTSPERELGFMDSTRPRAAPEPELAPRARCPRNTTRRSAATAVPCPADRPGRRRCRRSPASLCSTACRRRARHGSRSGLAPGCHSPARAGASRQTCSCARA